VKPFEIARVFDAPRDKVWKAWTEAERLKQWWGPAGFKVHTCKVDLRPGGIFLYGMKAPDGSDMWGKMVYREIKKPERLVFINSFSDPKGGVTRHPWHASWPLEMLSTFTFEEVPGGEFDFFIGVNSNIDINYLKQLSPDTVHVRDITAGSVGLGLFGPKSRELAQSLTRDDLSNEALGYFRLKSLYLGHVPVMLCRLSYVGELGYEIYTSADLALKLWDTLWQTGKNYGLIAAGRGAFNSMRLEKGYRSYGTDMNSEHNPHEAGLSFAVRKGGGYIGAEAYNSVDPKAVSRRLVCLKLEIHPLKDTVRIVCIGHVRRENDLLSNIRRYTAEI
jgi:uncharacterized protein YndB with AHSA1/START domain